MYICNNMGKKYIFKFVNVYGVKFVTYFTYDENDNLIDSGYNPLYQYDNLDVYEKQIKEDFAKYPDVKLIIERLDKYGTHS